MVQQQSLHAGAPIYIMTKFLVTAGCSIITIIPRLPHYRTVWIDPEAALALVAVVVLPRVVHPMAPACWKSVVGP